MIAFMNRRKRFLVLLLLLAAAFICYLIKGGYIELPDPSETETTEHVWNLILINKDYKIPKNLDIELMELSNGQKIDKRIYPELQQMFDDMREQGIYPVVASGYRTDDYQRMLLEQEIEDNISKGYSEEAAKAEAKMWVAEPGHSEHQTGLAVDINADWEKNSSDEVYGWLASYAWKYGFIYRYPEDKIDITGVYCEPWHYRYVGKDAAAVIYEQNLSLEEYIDLYF